MLNLYALLRAQVLWRYRLSTLKLRDQNRPICLAFGVFIFSSLSPTWADNLVGTDAHDHFVATANDDYLRGFGGDDTYELPSVTGSDIVYESSGFDTLVFPPGINPTDIDVSTLGGNLAFAWSEQDQVIVNGWVWSTNNYIERFEFSSGEVFSELTFFENRFVGSTGGAGDDTLQGVANADVHFRGLEGDDHLLGKNGNDIFEGGTGFNTLRGNQGDDTYLIEVNVGHHMIHENTGEDTVKFIGSVEPMDVEFSVEGVHLALTVTPSQKITFRNWLWGDQNFVEHFEFASGAYSVSDLIGSNTVLNRGGLEDDVLWDLEGYPMHFEGLAGDDVIRADSADDTLIGGPGNDDLQGKGGNDDYHFELGDGHDVVGEDGGLDTFVFGAGIIPSAIEFALNNNNLVIKYSATDRIEIPNWLSAERFQIEQFVFANGTTLSQSAFLNLASIALIGTEQADNLSGAENIVDHIDGLGGDDKIIGRNSAETLIGGTGNDEIFGYGGDDTYLYSLGHGNDVWKDQSGEDTVQFGCGISLDNTKAEQVDSHLVLTFKDGATLTLHYWYSGTGYQFERFEFFSGESLTHGNIMTLADLYDPSHTPNCSDTPVANVAPEISSSPILSTFENSLYSYQVLASDSDSTQLQFSLTNAPLGMTIEPSTGLVQWTSDFEDSGTYPVTIRVEDETALSDEQSFELVVQDVNRVPSAYAQSHTLLEDQSLAMTLTGVDLDGDTLSYKVSVAPSHGALSGLLPNVSYLPNPNFNGVDSFTYSVSDGVSDSDNATVTLTVTPSNDPPAFVSSPITTANEGLEYQYSPVVSDPDDSSVGLSLVAGPDGMLLDTLQNKLLWVPDFHSAGTYAVQLRATDVDGAFVDQHFTLIVRNTNRPPVAQSQVLQGDIDQSLNIVLTASDPDGDPLTYSVISAPQNGLLTGTAPNILYTPNPDFVGTDIFEYKVSDHQLDSDTTIIELNIEAVNTAPSIVSEPSLLVTQGESWVYTVDATDVDGDSLHYEVISGPPGVSFSSTNSNTLFWSTNDVGARSFDFEILVSDSAGAETFQEFSVEVLPNSSPSTHLGNEFWIPLAVPEIIFQSPRPTDPAKQANFYLFLKSGGQDVNATIRHEPTGRDETVFIPKDEIITYLIPGNEIEQAGGFELQQNLVNHAIHISSDDEITVYGLNQQDSSSDGFLAYPSNSLGIEYLVGSYHSSLFSDSENARESVVILTATEDDTTVEIKAPMDLFMNDSTVILKGDPYLIQMNQGDVYHLQARGSRVADLSGTLVNSNKPIAVFGMHICANVPRDRLACDQLIEQMPPTHAFGQEFVTAPLASRPEDIFRLIARHNDTHVYIDGVLRANLDQYEIFEWSSAEGQHLESTKPVLLMQYAIGQGLGNTLPGDPFMLLVPPIEQFLSSYLINTPTDNIRSNYVNVVVHQNSISSLRFDGQDLSEREFVPVGDSEFVYLQLGMSEDTHRLEADTPFGATVYGFDEYDSYGYPAGMSFGKPSNVSSISVVANSTSIAIGSEVCLTATAVDLVDKAVKGVQIKFDNPNSAIIGFDITNEQGEANFCFTEENIGSANWRASINDIAAEQTINWLQTVETSSPVITSVPNTQIDHGELGYEYQVNAFDPHGGTLTYRIIKRPSTGSSMRVSDEGVVSWDVPAFSPYLKAEAIVEVSNAFGLSTTQAFQLYQSPLNRAPIFNVKTPGDVAVVGVPFVYNPRYIDSTQERLKYAFDIKDDVGLGSLGGDSTRVQIIEGPDNAVIEKIDHTGALAAPECIACTQVLRWIPQQPGDALFKLIARDARGAVSDERVLNVNVKQNTPPRLSVFNRPEVISTNKFYRIYLDVENDVPMTTNSNLDNLEVILEHSPSGMSVQRETHTTGFSLLWRPTSQQIGPHYVELYVSDTLGQSETLRFEFEVVEGNTAPNVTSPSGFQLYGESGVLFDLQLNASDPEHDDVTFHLIDPPNGMTISENGRITFIPEPAQGDPNAFQTIQFLVALSDATGSQRIKTYVLYVSPFTSDAPDEPTLFNLVNVPPKEAFSGELYRYRAAATANHGGAVSIELIHAPPGMTITENKPSPGYFEINWETPTSNCNHDITIQLSDSFGHAEQVTFNIDVYEAPKRLNRFQCSAGSACSVQ